MSGMPDLEVEPEGDFADYLEHLLMAEMGWEAEIRVRPRSAEPVRPMARTRRFGIAIAAALVTATVTGVVLIDRDISQPGLQVHLDLSATVPASTATPSTTTVSAATPSVTAELPPAMPLAKPLAADTTYRLGRAVLGRSIRFTNPDEGIEGQWDTGGFVLTSSADTGNQLLLGAVHLDRARVVTDPLADASTLSDEGLLMAATSEPPTDYLAYFAALPGIEVGEIRDTEFAGQPAQAMSWTFGALERGSPCARGEHCVHAIWFPGTRRDGGRISSYTSGDAGTTYVFDLDGETVVVEVQDRPGARELAESLVIGQ